MHRALVLLFIPLVKLICGPASAQALYPEPPAPDSAFVRLLQDPAADYTSVHVGDRELPVNTDGQALYAALQQGNYSATLPEGNSVPLNLEAQTFYSLLLRAGEQPVVVTDPIASNPAKATLIFYNLSYATSVDLRTADGQTTILSTVEPSGGKSREVNAIKLSFSVGSGVRTLAKSDSIQLRRGSVYTIIYATRGGLTVYDTAVSAVP